MGKKQDLLIKDYAELIGTPNHLECEMYERMAQLNKQINAIKEILEVQNEK